MRKLSLVIFSTAFIAALGASEPARAGDGAVLGTTFGAVAGGLLGSQIGQGSGQFVSTTLGVALGATVGNAIGRDIDMDSSRSYPSGGYAPTSYYSPITYYSYTPNYVAPPAPPPTYVDQSAGTYCRPYSQEIRIDGQQQESYGTACLQPDGTWRIVQ